ISPGRRHAADQMSLLRRAPRARIQLRRPGASGAGGRSGRAVRSGVGLISLYAPQPQGRARGALAPRARLRALLQCAARYHDRPDTRDLPRRRAPAEARCLVSGYRTESGGLIDRTRPLRFRFDGRALQGFAGDTLASALLANGIHLVGRSFKYHRPRGILSAGADEPNALISVRAGGGRYTPNLRATQIELYEGLDAISQNRWPSLRFDLGAVN